MTTLGTPLTAAGTRVLMLGAGELGKEVVIELQRLGVETIAADRYANAPAMQVAHRSHVLDMLDPRALRELVEQERPQLIVPEIFETSLALVSHVLLFLNVPAREVLETTEDIRHDRYAILRSVFKGRQAGGPAGEGDALRQQLRTVVLPPGARAVGRTLGEVGLERGGVVVTALRREGIVGREPDAGTRLREGDVLVLWGTPADLERGESRLLMG